MKRKLENNEDKVDKNNNLNNYVHEDKRQKTSDVDKSLNDSIEIDVNARDAEGNTPLHSVEDVETAKLLIFKGAEVNASNEKGMTPLHLVKDVEIAELLISKGAEVYARDAEGNTPLHFVKDLKIAELLIFGGAEITAKNKNNYPPIYLANSMDIAKLMISSGATATAKIKDIGIFNRLSQISFDNSAITTALLLKDFNVHRDIEMRLKIIDLYKIYMDMSNIVTNDKTIGNFKGLYNTEEQVKFACEVLLNMFRKKNISHKKIIENVEECSILSKNSYINLKREFNKYLEKKFKDIRDSLLIIEDELIDKNNLITDKTSQLSVSYANMDVNNPKNNIINYDLLYASLAEIFSKKEGRYNFLAKKMAVIFDKIKNSNTKEISLEDTAMYNLAKNILNLKTSILPTHELQSLFNNFYENFINFKNDHKILEVFLLKERLTAQDSEIELLKEEKVKSDNKVEELSKKLNDIESILINLGLKHLDQAANDNIRNPSNDQQNTVNLTGTLAETSWLDEVD